jgi:hypothetical protein
MFTAWPRIAMSWNRDGFASRAQQLLDPLRVAFGLREMDFEDGGEPRLVDEGGSLFQELSSLLLDRVGVDEVLGELIVEFPSVNVAQRRRDGDVKALGEPLCHPPFVVEVGARDLGRLLVLGARSRTPQQLVRGDLHVLV